MVRMRGRQTMAGALDVIEIAVGPELQVESELVEMLAGHAIIVEVFVEIDLAVPIEVVQARDLISAQDKNLAIHNLKPQRLEQSGSDPLPGQIFQIAIHARDDPHIPAPGA